MKHISAKNIVIAFAAALGLSVVQGAQAADKGCSNASLYGTFGYTATGVLTAPPSLAGSFATVGAQTFDGSGRNGVDQPEWQHRSSDHKGDIHCESGLHRHHDDPSQCAKSSHGYSPHPILLCA